ncbi:MAG: pentapeptide repeat-containing protein, partial [Clostridium sp.]|nr:pentapeptide repeat-containing protein [Clostridium sp.]
MSDKQININKENLYKNLRGQCMECFGLCCTALYFSKTDGFPQNKDAGKPCLNLENNYKCKVHNNLIKKGLKGCTSYDCFGAGQRIAQVTYKGDDWRSNPEKSQEMFDAFLV